MARVRFYDDLISTSKDSATIQSAIWMRKVLLSKLHPGLIMPQLLKKYAGNYSGSKVSFENGNIYFTPSDGYKDILITVSPTEFAFNTWKFDFVKTKKEV